MAYLVSHWTNRTPIAQSPSVKVVPQLQHAVVEPSRSTGSWQPVVHGVVEGLDDVEPSRSTGSWQPVVHGVVEGLDDVEPSRSSRGRSIPTKLSIGSAGLKVATRVS